MRYDPMKALAPVVEAAEPVTATRLRPYVVAQLGQSLDGRIATPTGKSKYISSDAALTHLHRLRAAVDAVIVGVGTMIADDPQLTVRRVPGRSPLRVVIDPNGRLPSGLRCLEPGAPGRTLAVRAEGVTAPEQPGLESIALPTEPNGTLAPEKILCALAQRGVRSVLIEGGADTLTRALEAGVVDMLHVMVAPVILGSGTAGLSLPPIDELDEAIHPTAHVYAFDDGDALFCCDLRRRRRAAPAPLDIPLAAAE